MSDKHDEPAEAIPPGRAARRRGGSDGADFGIEKRLWGAGAAIVLLGLMVGGWGASSQLESAVIAQGLVVVERNVKKVQHREGGIVAAILVREGERVAAGQTLIKLDDTQTRAELGIVQSQIVELTGRKTRLLAERDGLGALAFPPEFAGWGEEGRAVIAGETRLFQETRRTRDKQKEQIGLRKLQLGDEVKGMSLQRDARKTELSFISKELEQVRSLQLKQLTPISRVYAMEREAARLTGELGNIVAQIARAHGQINELDLQLLTIDQNARTEAQRELRTVEARISELLERRAAAIDRLARVELKAPRSGIVHELAVHTVGGVLSSAEPAMLIVPEDEQLTIEARIAPHDRDQVAIGQKARLRFSAFNQRTTPEFMGSIVLVAADITKDPKTGQAYYSARVELVAADKSKVGALKIVPGMPVEAFISTGERTALSYLMKPLTDQFARAFKEE